MKTPIFPITGPYTRKDQAKSDLANKFIGRGSARSSTNRYREAWGELANCGQYQAADTVFVSAEGNRVGALKPDLVELAKATDAKATIITDKPEDRNRPYNTGEREVAQFLQSRNYSEYQPGIWKPAW
jgi:hypothetical protein